MQFTKIVPQVLRWSARLVGTLILAFVLLHLVGTGPPRLLDLNPQEGFLWLGFLLSLVGFAMLWKWELTGGIIALVGIALFYVMNFVLSDKLPGGWVLPLFFLPGLFSITCWLIDGRSEAKL